MSAGSFEQLLDQAASLCGIEPDYWDVWGRRHVTPLETKQAILRAMGWACETPGELRRSLAERSRLDWGRLAPPVIVTGESEFVELPLAVAAEDLGEQARLTVRREDGTSAEFTVELGQLAQTGAAEMDGRTWVRRLARLPARLPLGYHEIVSEAAGQRALTRYIVAPERAFLEPHLARGERAAGLAVSLYGLRSERNWGCGDFRDLADLIDWAAERLDVSFIALNPLHAIHNRRPFNASPYLPNSIFYRNFLYLDMEGMEDFERNRRARALRATPAVEAEIEALRQAPFVEYERVAALKLRFLKLLFAGFLREWRKGSARAREFEAFRSQEGELLGRFAAHGALDEHLRRRDPAAWVWTQWPAAYQDPDSAATREFRRRRWRSVMLGQYVQWQIDIQLRRAQLRASGRHRSIGLFHDLALATDRFGADLWGHREFYITGARVGSPPDDFSPLGQDWGFPPPNAERHREDGYQRFAESIRKNCRRGGALRIDHVMRLFRLFWIPEGGEAAHGAYVRERWEELVRVMALESVRHGVTIVGEDLGTVEPEVRQTLARFGVLSYRLLLFERRADGSFQGPEEYPSQALVASTTHDLPTLAGFWIGADLEARRAAGSLDEETWRRQREARRGDKQKLLNALFKTGLLPPDRPRDVSAYPELSGELRSAVAGFLARTPAQLWAINQEDLTGETAQQNLPGTTWQYPNWGRKMRYSLEQLRSDPEAAASVDLFRRQLESAGRRNRADESALPAPL